MCDYQVKALGENWVLLLKRDEKQVFRHHPSLSMLLITLAKFLGGCGSAASHRYMYSDCLILPPARKKRWRKSSFRRESSTVHIILLSEILPLHLVYVTNNFMSACMLLRVHGIVRTSYKCVLLTDSQTCIWNNRVLVECVICKSIRVRSKALVSTGKFSHLLNKEAFWATCYALLWP